MLTREQQEIAYQIARSVREGRISKSNGKLHIQRELGLKNSSAGYMIYVYLKMIEGFQYKRALNSSDTEYFLERIGSDEGLEALSSAVHALRLHIEYREGMGVIQHTNRQILQRYEGLIQQMASVVSVQLLSINELNERFLRQVHESLNDTVNRRRQRLSIASKIPRKITQTVYVYQRNPDVVAEVLARANGVCERCLSKAPFLRKTDRTPYLEVHHRLPLADGGEDTIDNAIALCPNCHRGQHFGIINV